MRETSVATLCSGILLAAVVGCGSRTARPATDLTLVAVNSFVGRAAFHLTCGPPGGNIGQSARACAAVLSDPTLVVHPKPFICRGGTFSWWDITIIGQLQGRPIRTHVSTCWTPQMVLIGRLGLDWQSLRAHLLPRRREAVLPGQPETFPPGGLRPGDLVTCRILGHELEAGIPVYYGTSRSGYGGTNVAPVTLSVTHNRDGSVAASCRRGEA